MANLNNSETLFVVCEKSECTWTLHNFSEVVDKDERELLEQMESPEFPENERLHKWKIRIYPKDIKRSKYFGAFLTLSTQQRNNVITEYSFILKNSDDELIKSAEGGKSCYNCDDCWGFEKIVNLNELLKSIRNDGILKICVFVSIEVFAMQSHHLLHNLEDEEISITKLFSELRTSVKYDKFHDCTIKVNNGIEIPVHRSILAARSPVFSAMFKHDVIEKQLGCVEINDVDESTMRHLLNFIYMSDIKSDELSVDETKKLYMAADKYAILDLRSLCSGMLARNMTVSNVLDILIFSEIRSDTELKRIAFDYIIANFWKFCSPEKLEKMKIYPKLLSEIVAKIFKLCQNKFEIKL